MKKKKKNKKIDEPLESRLERIALAKCMVSKSVPDKKKFNKKKERQNKSFLSYWTNFKI